MTQKAPERIWAYEHCEQVTAARSSVMFPIWAEAYEYIRAEHAQAAEIIRASTASAGHS